MPLNLQPQLNLQAQNKLIKETTHDILDLMSHPKRTAWLLDEPSEPFYTSIDRILSPDGQPDFYQFTSASPDMKTGLLKSHSFLTLMFFYHESTSYYDDERPITQGLTYYFGTYFVADVDIDDMIENLKIILEPAHFVTFISKNKNKLSKVPNPISMKMRTTLDLAKIDNGSLITQVIQSVVTNFNKYPNETATLLTNLPTNYSKITSSFIDQYAPRLSIDLSHDINQLKTAITPHNQIKIDELATNYEVLLLVSALCRAYAIDSKLH